MYNSPPLESANDGDTVEGHAYRTGVTRNGTPFMVELAGRHDNASYYADDVDDQVSDSHIHGGTEDGGGSVASAIFNLLKTIIGAGIFTMPSAFYDGGFFASIVILLVVGAIVNWTITILVSTGIKSNLKDYEKLARYATGRVGYILYLASALMFAYGACAAYSVVISDRFPAVINAFSNISYDDISTDASATLKFFMDRRISVLIISVLVLYPVSSLRYLKNMSLFSLAGLLMFFWVAVTSVVISWTLSDDQKGSRDPSDIYTIIKPSGIVSTLSRAAFAVVCHHNQFIIYRSIKNPTLKKYSIVSQTSIWLSVLGGTLFGLLGYIPLVEKSRGNILNSLPEDNIWVKIASLAFCIDVILTYPLELFVCRDLLEKLIHGKKRNTISKYLRHLYTAILVAGTIIISVSVCDLNTVIDLTGGVASSAIAFIFPPLLHMIMRRRNSKTPIPLTKFITNIIVILFGVLVMIYALYDVISAAVSSQASSSCKYKLL